MDTLYFGWEIRALVIIYALLSRGLGNNLELYKNTVNSHFTGNLFLRIALKDIFAMLKMHN